MSSARNRGWRVRLLGSAQEPSALRLLLRYAYQRLVRQYGKVLTLFVGPESAKNLAPKRSSFQVFFWQGVQSREISASLPRMRELKDLHKGRAGWVVGNGPSLRFSDLELLQDQISIASNKIFLAFHQTSWRPTYFTVVDYVLWPKIAGDIGEWFDEVFISSQLDAKLTDVDSVLIKARERPTGKVSPPSFSTEPRKGFFMDKTVTMLNLQLGAYLGLNPLILTGIDHRYRGEDGLGGLVQHRGQSNHFHPDYRVEGEPVLGANVRGMENAYREARDWGQANGVEILNASRRTELDVFPRIAFEDALRLSRSRV